MLEPIDGPGVCGADFPLKVGELGEDAPLGYTDEALRPPSDVPQAGPASPRSPAPPAYPADDRQPPNPQYRAAPPRYPANT